MLASLLCMELSAVGHHTPGDQLALVESTVQPRAILDHPSMDGSCAGDTRHQLPEFLAGVPVGHPFGELLGQRDDVRLVEPLTIETDIAPEGREDLPACDLLDATDSGRRPPEAGPQGASLPTGPSVEASLPRMIPRAAELVAELAISILEERYKVGLPRPSS